MENEKKIDYKNIYDIFIKNLEDNRLDKGLFSLLRFLIIELRYIKEKKDIPASLISYKKEIFDIIKKYRQERKLKNLQDTLDIKLNDYIDYLLDIHNETYEKLFSNGYFSKREYNLLYKGWRLTNKTIYKLMDIYDIDKNFWQLFIK